MDTTERRTELDLTGHLPVEYLVFGKFTSGGEGDKGWWDHHYVTIEEMMDNLDDDDVDQALDAYDDRVASWREHMQTCVLAEREVRAGGPVEASQEA